MLSQRSALAAPSRSDMAIHALAAKRSCSDMAIHAIHTLLRLRSASAATATFAQPPPPQLLHASLHLARLPARVDQVCPVLRHAQHHALQVTRSLPAHIAQCRAMASIQCHSLHNLDALLPKRVHVARPVRHSTQDPSCRLLYAPAARHEHKIASWPPRSSCGRWCDDIPEQRRYAVGRHPLHSLTVRSRPAPASPGGPGTASWPMRPPPRSSARQASPVSRVRYLPSLDRHDWLVRPAQDLKDSPQEPMRG